jgi:outer membrane protein
VRLTICIVRNVVFLIVLIVCWITVRAENLLEVYHQALSHDAIYQQAIAQRLFDKENTPIQFSQLLPHLNVTVTPSIYKSANSGLASNGIGSYSQRGYQINIVLTQTLYDAATVDSVLIVRENAKVADAIFNLKSQELILRVSNAYFAILQDEDNLRYIALNKSANAFQLKKIQQEYLAGTNTIINLQIAKSAYDFSVSDYIAAKNKLIDDQENLRVITGRKIISLEKLNDKIIFPQFDIEIACQQNWAVKAAQYANSSALINVRQQAHHYWPTINIQGMYDINFQRNTGGTGPIGSLLQPSGRSISHNRSVQVNFVWPLFSGGETLAKHAQAQQQYQVTTQQLVKTIRDTLQAVHQNYFAIKSSFNKLHADKKAIFAAKNALYGMQSQYRLGVTTLMDVLLAQEYLLNAEKQYSADRYDYEKNILLLKQAAGTLNEQDLILDV